MLLHHLTTAVRIYIRNKSVTLINFLGMSIGFASIIIISNWVFYEFSFDNFHENKDRIYRVIEKQSFKGQDEKYLSSMPEWLIGTFEKEIQGVEASTGLLNVGSRWMGEKDNRVEARNVTFADNNIFKVFTFNIVEGSLDNALAEPQNTVITESLANRLSPDKSPLGNTLIFQDQFELVIKAIVEDLPENSHFQTEMLVSMESRKPMWNMDDYNHIASIYLLLDKKTDPTSLFDPLQEHRNNYMKYDAAFIEFQIQPLADIHLRSTHTMWGQNYKKSDIKLVIMFIVIGLLVIVISTINYVNLTTASMSNRIKEFGLKRIVGSSKLNLIVQFLSESFIFLFISFWISLLLVEVVNPILDKLQLLEHHNLLYQKIWFFPLVIIIIFGLSLLSGIYPAFVLSSVKPVSLFKKNLGTNLKGLALKRILVIAQLSVTSILIVVAIYISKQINYMKNKNLGFSSEAVISFWPGQGVRDNYETFKSELLKHNNVLGVTSSNVPLGNSMWRNCIHFEGEPQGENWVTPYISVDYNYFDFFKMDLVEGRAFNKEFVLDRENRAFVINETLARKMGGNDIIGRKFRTCNCEWGEIVGVVKDFNYRSLHHDIEPLAFQLGQFSDIHISVRSNAENIQGTISILEESWKKYQPKDPFYFRILDQSLNDLYVTDQKTARIEMIFCAISIILSCIGLLGMYLFVTENRTKEIGIRKVNGASVKNILALLSNELLINILLALCFSIPIGWIVIRSWSDNFAYKTQISWWIFAGSGILIFLLAGLTISYHTIKASIKNPVDALRYE